MTTSHGRPRVCGDLSPCPASRRRASAALALALLGTIAVGPAPASAANNPGTGDPGFFSFRPSTPSAGSQVNVASGNLLIRTRDLTDSPLNYSVVVDRTYNSLAPSSFSILGPRWGFDIGPATAIAEETGGDVILTGPSGYTVRFLRQSDGSYQAPVGFDGALEKTASGWTLRRTSQSDEFGFNGSGQLSTTRDAQARDFTVQATSAAGRTVLSSYGTTSGRRVNLSYNGDSLVREMDDPSSGHHYYTYAAGKLTGYQAPSGAQTAYRYDANGLLDRITAPGGATVDVDNAVSGRVRSLTSTVAGGVPQTTSFVYTRRPYKSDVTAPDATRRTYAYDADWRVTRHYDPDIAPTVTASGELRDLADQYVNGNQTYPVNVAAEEPDGAGLTRLALQHVGGNEIAHEDPPCVDTPFDRICPTTHTAVLSADLTSLPEGRQTVRVTAVDDEQNAGHGDPWAILVDRTPPAAPTAVRLGHFDPADNAGVASIDWDTSGDPDLPGGIPGSGIDTVQVRYRVNGAPFTSWSPTQEDTVDLPGRGAGDHLEFELRTVDQVGNVSAVGSASIAVAEQLEDPVVEQLAADYYVGEYGGTIERAKAWLRVQDKASSVANGDLSADISGASPGGFGGIWFDNEARRVVVNLAAGVPRAPVEQVLADRGLESVSDIRAVTYTQRKLEEEQLVIEGQLAGLFDAGVISLGRAVSKNAIEIEIATSATAAQVALVHQVADDAEVRVLVVESDSVEGSSFAACRFPEGSAPACDRPLRGGVRIDAAASGGRLQGCTSGFNTRAVADDRRYMLTAGHCLDGAADGRWYAYDYKFNRFLVGDWHRFYVGAEGDVGTVRLDRWSDEQIRSWVFVTKAEVAAGPRTSRNPHYPIRRSAPNKEGAVVCTSGMISGSRCGEVIRLAKSAKVDGKKVHGLASTSVCVSQGDSGGPVFKGGLAYGLISIRRESAFTGHCRGSLIQGARTAEATMNVRIGN